MKRWMLLAGFLMAMGCELPETDTLDEGSESTSTDADSADWDNIQWHGEAFPNAVEVMTLTASVSANHVHFTWDTWPWGNSMGLGHFFWWNGTSWQGGKFEWIRAGGQAVKLLENIRNGYNGLRVPASGTAVAFAWTSANGSERSNLARTTWP